MSEKETRLIHMQIVGGDEEDILAFGKHLNKIKDMLRKSNFPYELEFIITTERIELHSVKYLLTQLHDLYKREQKRLDVKKQNMENIMIKKERKDE